MRKFISILLLSATVLITVPVMAVNILPEVMLLLNDSKANIPNTEKAKKLSALNSILCKSGKCNIYKEYPTSQKCIESFDQYFEISGGEMPSCIPWFTEIKYGDPLPKSELFCYANWKVLVREECDPIFDPGTNEYGIIDESDGTSPYEICLMNRAAQKDSCMLALKLICLSSCRTEYVRPCYQEYLITNDKATLDECLAEVQPKVDKCEKKEEKIERDCSSYLYQQ